MLIYQLHIEYVRFVAKEESGRLGRALCNPYHALKLHFHADDVDSQDGEILEITKPYKYDITCNH
jgi:hypothetical protein